MLFWIGLPPTKLHMYFAKLPCCVLEFEKRRGIADRRFDLEPVADDAGIVHQARDVALAEARDAFGIEAGERLAIAFALVENRRPRQAGLRALENQELELRAVVPRRHAPLLVVVVDVKLVAVEGPGAAGGFTHVVFRRQAVSGCRL